MNTKVISFSSGKGGVGKTSLSLNLAVILAQRGKQVLLIDGDWALGKMSIALGVRPQWTIEKVLSQEISLKEAIWPLSSTLSLLASPTGVLGFEQLNDSLRHQLYFEMEKLNGLFDFILLDQGSGIHPSVSEFAAASHHQVVVTTPEPTSYTDAYAIMKILSKKFAIRHFELVVTMAPEGAETEQVVTRFCDVVRSHLDVRVTLLDTLPWEPKLAEAFRRQKPLVSLWPGCDFAQRLGKLADRLMVLPSSLHSGLQFFQSSREEGAGDGALYERDGLCRA